MSRHKHLHIQLHECWRLARVEDRPEQFRFRDRILAEQRHVNVFQKHVLKCIKQVGDNSRSVAFDTVCDSFQYENSKQCWNPVWLKPQISIMLCHCVISRYSACQAWDSLRQFIDLGLDWKVKCSDVIFWRVSGDDHSSQSWAMIFCSESGSQTADGSQPENSNKSKQPKVDFCSWRLKCTIQPWNRPSEPSRLRCGWAETKHCRAPTNSTWSYSAALNPIRDSLFWFQVNSRSSAWWTIFHFDSGCLLCIIQTYTGITIF